MNDTLNTLDSLSTATDIVKAIKEAEYRGYMKAVADRPQGEWIDPAAEDCYRCSVCEKYTQMETPRLLYHYCPRCGARMKGADDGTR